MNHCQRQSRLEEMPGGQPLYLRAKAKEDKSMAVKPGTPEDV
jgi:hypothetical protein